MKVLPGRIKAGPRELRTKSAFHLLVPVIEYSFGNAYQRDRTAVLDTGEKINVEQLQPAFPLRPAKGLAAYALEVGDVFASASAVRSPLVTFGRLVEVEGAHRTVGVGKPFAEIAITRVTDFEDFGGFHRPPFLRRESGNRVREE